jgi:hypothetical protein
MSSKKQTLESWNPGILGPSSPDKLAKNQKNKKYQGVNPCRNTKKA